MYELLLAPRPPIELQEFYYDIICSDVIPALIIRTGSTSKLSYETMCLHFWSQINLTFSIK